MPPVREQPDPSTPSLQPVGQHQGKQPLTLGRLITLIGSAPSARLYLPSKAVSRCHAAVINTGGVVFIRDLASRTRTRVNGRPVKEAELSDGDVIEVAMFAFRFTRPGAATPALPRPPAPRPPLPSGALEVDDLDDPVPLDTRVLLIGRRETADISLVENAASSAHALLLAADGKHLVRDLNSRTGTFVNGVKIHEHVLSSGDVIRVGETSFRYVQSAAAPRSTERPAKDRPAVEAPTAVPLEEPAPSPALTEAAEADDLIAVDVAPELPVEPPLAEEEDRPRAGSADNDNGVGVLELAEAAREPEVPAAPADDSEPAAEDDAGGAEAAPAEMTDDLELAPDDDEEPEPTATLDEVFDGPAGGASARSDFIYEGFENVRADDSAPGSDAAPMRNVTPPSDKRRRWSHRATSKSDKLPPGQHPIDPLDVLSDIDDLEPLPLRPPQTPPPGPPPTLNGRE
jgi:pSer/pThr/pTyr-binding forkhead associated (FHA) protein